MWLGFLYSNSKAAESVNKWFVPAGWFLPGLMVMQFVSIFFPLLNVYQSWKRQKVRDGDYPSLVNAEFGQSTSRKNQDLYSMASFEMQLDKNIGPLLQWAAQKEFSAENIVFLRSVLDFKRKWELASKRGPLSTSQESELYEEAALVFFTVVNPQTARFNINIDHRTYLALSDMFSGCAYRPTGDGTSCSGKSSQAVSDACPWETNTLVADDRTLAGDGDKSYPLPGGEITAAGGSIISSACSTLGCPAEEQPPSVPPTFDVHVFDKAYAIIKRDVFLNTWARYEARYAKPRPSLDSPLVFSSRLELPLPAVPRPGSCVLRIRKGEGADGVVPSVTCRRGREG